MTSKKNPRFYSPLEYADADEIAPIPPTTPSNTEVRMPPESQKCRKSWFRENILLLLTIGSVFFGTFLGIGLRFYELSPSQIEILQFPGEIFMQLLKMMILPVVISSLISALAKMDPKESTRLGLFTAAYYFFTATLASLLAVFVTLLVNPGVTMTREIQHTFNNATEVSAAETFMELMKSLFPENIIQATFERTQIAWEVNDKGEHVKIEKHVRGPNVLGIVAFCTIFGMVLSRRPSNFRVLVDFFSALDEAIMSWVSVVMWFAPIGITSLIAGNIAELKDLEGTVTEMSWFVLTVFICLFVHGYIVIPLLYVCITMRNPLTVFKGMLQAFVTTIGTASGGATLPVSIECAENKLAVNPNIARFVFPLGATINVDGNALYEAVGAMFIAQKHGIPLTFSKILSICVTSTMASIGVNSVPAGLVSILVILNSVGLPTSDVALLFTVDWFIDRIRTAVNVVGDGFAASVVEYLHEFVPDEMLFFEVRREKLHVFVEGRTRQSCADLKKSVAQILGLKLSSFQLCKLNDDYSQGPFLEDKKSLYESGFTGSRTNVITPGQLGMLYKTDQELVITPMPRNKTEDDT